MMFDGACKRRDRAMAGVVNTALAMQRVAGRHAADDYLTRHQVPDKVIVRALSSSGQKREQRERSAAPDGADAGLAPPSPE